MAKLVLTAENFAFGPIGKLLDIAKLLKDQGHELIFAGFGTALQLAEGFPFTKIYKIDTDNPASKDALEKVITQADLVISCMDLPSVIVAKRLGKPVVWVDCLFWFWEYIPEPLFDIDLYVRERSLKDRVNELKYGTKIKNLFSVGPIIPKIMHAERKSKALISFGGGEASYWYKSGIDSNYPFVMTDILLKNVDWSRFERTIVTTSKRILKELSKRFPLSPFKFSTCGSHDGFIKELSESEIVLITPGLVTSQSVFELGTPAIFLPPSNNSQYLQLNEFRKLGLAPASVHLSDFLPKLELRGKSSQETTKLVLHQLRELEQSPEIQTGVGIRICELVKNRQTWSSAFINNGRNFIDSLGGNGVQAVTDKITQLLFANGFH